MPFADTRPPPPPQYGPGTAWPEGTTGGIPLADTMSPQDSSAPPFEPPVVSEQYPQAPPPAYYGPGAQPAAGQPELELPAPGPYPPPPAGGAFVPPMVGPIPSGPPPPPVFGPPLPSPPLGPGTPYGPGAGDPSGVNLQELLRYRIPFGCPGCGARVRNVAPAWSILLGFWHRMVMPEFKCPQCGMPVRVADLDETARRRVLTGRVVSIIALVLINGGAVLLVGALLLTIGRA